MAFSMSGSQRRLESKVLFIWEIKGLKGCKMFLSADSLGSELETNVK